MTSMAGNELLFSLEMEGDDLRVVDPAGQSRTVTPPWKVDNQFWRAHHFYDRLTRKDWLTDSDRAELFSRATTLGSLLFGILFDQEGEETLRHAMISGRPRPLITIQSNDDTLLALPWELLCLDGSFLLKEGRVDLARSTGAGRPDVRLREPDSFLKLVVNVSAPEGSGLDYEGESFRVTKALSEQCRFMPTELGTVEDLVETVRVEKPTAIHFSGHGAPAALVFEDDEGRADVVPIHELLHKLRTRIDAPLPALFYLASCHGNDTGGSRTETSAACLHREGVTQVVGYDGPINDELSTRAEVAFYRALAEGSTTRHAIRQAREALAETSHPFAWAQLVFYHRGPDQPLSLPAARGVRPPEEDLRRTFTGVGDRRVLATGFIGRRSEMHQVRRRIRRGDRVLVFQGLGGLGKSTLAFHVLPMLQRGEGEVLVLWCQEVEQQPDRLEGLVAQLLDHCRKLFGLEWEPIVYQVDREAGDNALQRFALFIQALLQNVPRLVLYLDNLESLQGGLKDSKAEGDAQAIGNWISEELGQLWEFLDDAAQQVEHFYVVASCRYWNHDFGSALLPVSPLPPDALFRLMSWFPAFRRLSLVSRARLVERLAGHPRAVEYANDLLAYAHSEHDDHHRPWQECDPEREWMALVEPVLPKVQDKLWANLLLVEIWNRILTERERRMLYRMTLLRRPWKWSLMAVLGDEGEENETAFTTAEQLLRTSLIEQVERLTRGEGDSFVLVRHFTLHPSTVHLVRERFGRDELLWMSTHRRLGDHLEGEANKSHVLEAILEAGYHLFQAGEYDRACELLGRASNWLQEHGQARAGLQILEPFLAKQAREGMRPEGVGRLLGTLGQASFRLGEVTKAIGYHQQALIINREIGNLQGESLNLGDLGAAYLRLGEVKEAIGYLEQQVLISQENGFRQGLGNAFGNLGLAYSRLWHMDKAIGYHEKYLAIAREIGDDRGVGNALGSLGIAYSHLGELERAVKYFEEYLEIARAIDDHQGEGVALGNLGAICFLLNEVERAIGYYEQHLGIARQTGDQHGECNTLGNLGNAYSKLGEEKVAIGYYEKALVIAREVKDRRGQGTVVGNLGITYARLGEIGKAIALLEEALAIGREIGDPQITRNFSAELDNLHLNLRP